MMLYIIFQKIHESSIHIRTLVDLVRR